MSINEPHDLNTIFLHNPMPVAWLSVRNISTQCCKGQGWERSSPGQEISRSNQGKVEKVKNDKGESISRFWSRGNQK